MRELDEDCRHNNEGCNLFGSQVGGAVHVSKQWDYKRDARPFYVPKSTPEMIDVPSMPFLMIDGSGDPNGKAFAKETEALYSLSYAVKMSYKRDEVPEGYYPYTVFPLEGVWDLLDRSKPPTDKSNLKYTIMVRQPDFLTEPWFAYFLEQTKPKKSNPYLDHVRFETMQDGWSCQMMHIGSYDDEPESFARMEAYCTEHGWHRASKLHREIYLSDPRKIEAAKRKTVLRFSVAKC